jgi:hypothetical protein
MNVPTPEQQVAMIFFIVLLFAAGACVKLLIHAFSTRKSPQKDGGLMPPAPSINR